MKNLFRKKHLLDILNSYTYSDLPLDLHLKKSFKMLKQIGSKDRKEITNTIYTLIRFKGYYDYFCEKPINWEKRLKAFETPQNNPSNMANHIQVSFPKFLFDELVKNYGIEKTKQICNTLNQQAPTTLRINPLKTTREKLVELLLPYSRAVFCTESPYGITLSKRINFHLLNTYKQGLFEVQDEASQLVAMLAKVSPHEKVLDFCAGSGGKSLAFGTLMQNKGLLCLYDIRSTALIQAKKRFKKSGIQNVQFLQNEKMLKQFEAQMDWVFLDVPCSGTGTLRRNPEMKWKLSYEAIKSFVTKQREIFKNALKYLKPEGKLVYATCSILKEENEDQVAYFNKTFGMKHTGKSFSTLPREDGMDGFFGVVLQKK
jgi:16S rRNA (cytosine967-C5)-methyltransferase